MHICIASALWSNGPFCLFLGSQFYYCSTFSIVIYIFYSTVHDIHTDSVPAPYAKLRNANKILYVEFSRVSSASEYVPLNTGAGVNVPALIAEENTTWLRS